MEKDVIQQRLDERDYFLKMCQFAARPYLICICVLSALLAVSICANVYLATSETVVDFDVKETNQSDIIQQNIR